MTNHTQPLQYVQRQFQQAYVQRQFQQAYVQRQPQPLQYVQPQFQQAYVQRQPQPQQVVYVQYQQQKVNVQPKFQSFQYVQYQQQANVQYQQQVVYVQPQQVFYSNPPQQVAYNYLPTKFVYNNVHAQNLQNDPQQQQTFHNHLPKFVAQPLQSKQEPNYQLQKNNHTNGNMLDMFESVDSVAYSLCSSININDLNNLAKAYDKSNSSETNNLNSRSTSPSSVVLNPFVSFGPLQQQLQR